MHKSELKLIKEALQEKLMRSTDEAKDSEIAMLLSKIEGKLVEPAYEVYSREECVFHYCPTEKLCKEKNKCINVT